MHRRSEPIIVNPSNGDKGINKRIHERDQQQLTLMQQADGARVWSWTRGANEEVMAYAFLSIFHPDMDDQKRRELARDIGR